MHIDDATRRQALGTGQLPHTHRLVELDAVRGIAVIVVMLYHLMTTVPRSGQPWSMSLLSTSVELGWAGVDLFFVLSGFLIGLILLEHGRAPNFFAVFYARRSVRLFPLYLLLLLAYVVTAQLLPMTTPSARWLLEQAPGAPPLWSYVLYVHNHYIAADIWAAPRWLGVTWSLAIEEQFYLLAPLVILALPRERLLVWLCTLTAACIAWRTYYFGTTGDWASTYTLLAFRADGPLIGMIGAVLFADAGWRSWLKARIEWIKAGLYVSMTWLFMLAVTGLPYNSVLKNTLGHTIFAVISLNIIFAALFLEGRMANALVRNKPLIWMGSVSYAVYLFHQPVHGLIWHVARGSEPAFIDIIDVGLAIATIIVTLLLSQLTKIWLERPCQTFGRRLQYKPADDVRLGQAAAA